MAPPSPSPAPSRSSGSYYSEVAQLKQLIASSEKTYAEPAEQSSLASTACVRQRRHILRRILRYMMSNTNSIDMSALFADVVRMCETRDVVQKKMIFNYLTKYAEENADLTLLAINTLTKDCSSANPMVRGLALRSLCSLKSVNLAEYMMLPLRRGIADRHPYVRRIAVHGILQLFHLDPSFLAEVVEEVTDEEDEQEEGREAGGDTENNGKRGRMSAGKLRGEYVKEHGSSGGVKRNKRKEKKVFYYNVALRKANPSKVVAPARRGTMSAEILDLLIDCIYDPEPSVCVNAIIAVNEIFDCPYRKGWTKVNANSSSLSQAAAGDEKKEGGVGLFSVGNLQLPEDLFGIGSFSSESVEQVRYLGNYENLVDLSSWGLIDFFMFYSQDFVTHVLNVLLQVDEWMQCYLLKLVIDYVPRNVEEIYSLMNVLDRTISDSHSNPAKLVHATICFLGLSFKLNVASDLKRKQNAADENPESLPEEFNAFDWESLVQQILMRLKAPLLSFMRNSGTEMSFICLHIFETILEIFPRHVQFLENEHRQFFLSYGDNESTANALKKISLLSRIATPANGQRILDELCSYATDLSIEISRKSMEAIALVCSKIPALSTECIKVILKFINADRILHSPVCVEALIACREILVRHPQYVDEIVAAIDKHIVCLYKHILMSRTQYAFGAEEDLFVNGIISFAWILSYYAEKFDDSPSLFLELLEDLHVTDGEKYVLNEAERHSCLPAVVWYYILHCSCVLYFKLPRETEDVLIQLFRGVAQNCPYVDVKERCLLYFNLLSLDMEKSKQLLVPPPPLPEDVNAEDMNSEDMFRYLKFMERASSLSGMDGKTGKLDTDSKIAVLIMHESGVEQSSATDLLEEDSSIVDLQSKLSLLKLEFPEPSLNATQYEKLWEKCPSCFSFTTESGDIDKSSVNAKKALLERMLMHIEECCQVKAIASKVEEHYRKYYFYSQLGGREYILCCMEITMPRKSFKKMQLLLTVKGKDDENSKVFLQVLTEVAKLDLIT
eukprot:Nk52_evm1s393 gene=Nk52_evmTU1s393